MTFDASTLDDVDKTVMRCFEAAAEAVDLVIVAVGELGSQAADEMDPDRIARMMTVNLTWPAAALVGGGGSVAAAGSRTHRRAVLRGRIPDPTIQLRLRRGQGGPRRLRARTVRSPSWHRCLRAHRPTRLRSHQDDRRALFSTLRRRGFPGGVGHRARTRTWPDGDLVAGPPQVGVLCSSPAPTNSVAPRAGLRLSGVLGLHFRVRIPSYLDEDDMVHRVSTS